MKIFEKLPKSVGEGKLKDFQNSDVFRKEEKVRMKFKGKKKKKMKAEYIEECIRNCEKFWAETKNLKSEENGKFVDDGTQENTRELHAENLTQDGTSPAVVTEEKSRKKKKRNKNKSKELHVLQELESNNSQGEPEKLTMKKEMIISDNKRNRVEDSSSEEEISMKKRRKRAVSSSEEDERKQIKKDVETKV